MRLTQSHLTKNSIPIITDDASFKSALCQAARMCYDAVVRHATPPLERVSQEIMDAFYDYDPNVVVYEVQYYVNSLTIELLEGKNIDNIDLTELDDFSPSIHSVVYGDPSTYDLFGNL